MKSAYVICVLLGITIGSLVLADHIEHTTIKAQTSTSISPSNSAVNNESNGKTTSEPQTYNTSALNSTSIPESSTTATATSKSTLTTSISTTSAPTTSKPTPTTSKSTITTSSPTTSTISTTTSRNVSTSTAAIKTTAEPTTSPTSSKDRHFDGLSFFGGIILATCLMAIAAFSWKFYRQCNERNYRTL